MATVTSLTTTYAGEVAGGYILEAMKEMASLNHLTVRDNIPGKQVVRKLVNSISFAAQSCEASPTGSFSLTERILTLEWFQVHEKLCKTDFNFDWNNRNAPGLPDGLSEAVIANMLAGIAQKEENNIWSGVNANTGEHDGFKTLLLADSDVIDVSTPTTLSSSNIVAELKELIDTSLASASGPAVHGATERPKIYMGVVAAMFYQQAMAALGYNFQYQAGNEFPLKYMGYDIAVCPGMPNDTMVLAQPSNLWFGTDKSDSRNNIQVIDLQPTIGDKAILFAADFAFGVQYGTGKEITLYGT